MIEASPALQACFSKKKSKDAQNTKLSKRFRGGNLALVEAQASRMAFPTYLAIFEDIIRTFAFIARE